MGPRRSSGRRSGGLGLRAVVPLVLLALAAVLLVRTGATPGAWFDSQDAARLVAPAGTPDRPAPPSGEPGPGSPDRPGGTALSALDRLEVKGRAPMTGYDRELFGPSWADVDRNGCDTRNDMLARDLSDRAVRDGTQGCVVVSGRLADPYGAVVVPFRKQDASAVQIDHVVALANAWATGAQAWDDRRLREFANDPGNLLATQGRLNQQKGAGDAATWLPPSTSFRCAYVARQVAVKAAYGLWVTPAERAAVAGVLSSCPGEPAPPVTGPEAALAD